MGSQMLFYSVTPISCLFWTEKRVIFSHFFQILMGSGTHCSKLNRFQGTNGRFQGTNGTHANGATAVSFHFSKKTRERWPMQVSPCFRMLHFLGNLAGRQLLPLYIILTFVSSRKPNYILNWKEFQKEFGIFLLWKIAFKEACEKLTSHLMQ